MAAVSVGDGESRFPADLVHAAAVLYYLEDATQAEIGQRLRTSRATVSRLLAEARRRGVVTITVSEPESAASEDLAARVAGALSLASVHLAPGPGTATIEVGLGTAVSAALLASSLGADDVVLLSSGRMLYATANSHLPALPGVRVAPTVGGLADPEPWYQTNEITRSFAARVGGYPVFLHAPALPGAAVHASLIADPSVAQVLRLWNTARCAVVGVGAPPSARSTMPAFVPGVAGSLPHAVGDICSRYFDASGAPVDFPGSERMIGITLEQLRAVESTIAVAMGPEKVITMLVAARAGYFDRLVTDAATATLLLRAARDVRGGA